MNKSLSNKEKINKILNETESMLSIREIAEKSKEKEEYIIGGGTPEKTIGSLLYTDEEDLYKKNNERPAKWGLKKIYM